MTCKIERLAAGESEVILRVCGRVQAGHMRMIEELIGGVSGPVALDLTEVTLVDRDAVTLLSMTERNGVELRNCPAFLREWIASEQQRMAAETPHRASDAITACEESLTSGCRYQLKKGEHAMATITTKDGTQIYYKDWGKGQPIVFSHGWPLTGDDWDAQMLFFGQQGYRVVAHDRRGHGRSSQTWDGNEMDTYADDLSELFEKLELKNAIMVGHSTGGGEVARYLGRHGAKRVAKAVLISAVPPLMLKTEKNPTGAPLSVFDGLRAALAANRPQFYKDITLPFYGYNRPGAKISEGIREHWWLQGMMGGMKAHYDCIKAFSETDFTEDLKKIDIPVLVMHGEDDQIVPIVAAGPLSAKLLKNATLKVYPGFPHGMPTTNADQINADLLAFIKGTAKAVA